MVESGSNVTVIAPTRSPVTPDFPPSSSSNDFSSPEDTSSLYYDHEECTAQLHAAFYAVKKMHDNSANSSHVTSVTLDVTEASSCLDDFSHPSLEVYAVNTYSSILNITEDCDEEDDEDEIENETNFLFPDEELSDSYLNSSLLLTIADEDFEPESSYQAQNMADPTKQHAPQNMADPTKQHAPRCKDKVCLEHGPTETLLCGPDLKSSLLDQIDMFFERLCFSKAVEEATIPCDSLYRHESLGVLSVLACFYAPTAAELDYFASTQDLLASLVCQPNVVKKRSASRRTRRHSVHEQRARVDQLLQERGRSAAVTPLRRVRSMQEVTRKAPRIPAPSPLDLWMGLSKPVVHQPRHDDGYDSDPGIPYSEPVKQRSISPRSVVPECDESWQDSLYQTVQESMNCTWNLMFLRNGKPVQVSAWMERGTLIKNNSVMVEPRLMWRQQQQQQQQQQQSSNNKCSTCTPPEAVRLLHICRIRACSAADRAEKYSLRRASTSVMIRTVTGETFIFQAATVQERDAVMHQWKATIARFATLAVLEDVAILLREFFISNPASDDDDK